MRVSGLYITYDGLLDPLGQSQVLQYLRGSSKDISWTVLSFEKENLQQLKIDNMRWIAKKYHRTLGLKIWDITVGVFSILLRKEPFDFIHTRSYMAAFIALGVLPF